MNLVNEHSTEFVCVSKALESSGHDVAVYGALPVREQATGLPCFAELEALAGSAASTCMAARKARRTIEQQETRQVQTLLSNLQAMSDRARACMELLELDVERTVQHFTEESAACNDAMRAEAQKGRRLLADLAESRKAADARIMPVWAQAIKDELASACRTRNSAGSSDLLAELAELRTAARMSVTELEAEAAGAAAGCAEARALREEVACPRLQRSQNLQASVLSFRTFTERGLSSLKAEAQEVAVQCEEARQENEVLVRESAERGRLLLTKLAALRGAQASPATRSHAQASTFDDAVDDDVWQSSAKGHQLLAKASELAQEGLERGRALLARLADSPRAPGATIGMSMSPTAAMGSSDVATVSQHAAPQRGQATDHTLLVGKAVLAAAEGQGMTEAHTAVPAGRDVHSGSLHHPPSPDSMPSALPEMTSRLANLRNEVAALQKGLSDREGVLRTEVAELQALHGNDDARLHVQQAVAAASCSASVALQTMRAKVNVWPAAAEFCHEAQPMPPCGLEVTPPKLVGCVTAQVWPNATVADPAAGNEEDPGCATDQSNPQSAEKMPQLEVGVPCAAAG